MSSLAIASLVMGCVAAAAGMVFMARPEAVRVGLKAFPRHRASGIALTAVVIGWSAWLLYEAPLGRFEGLKRFIVFLAPVAVYMVARFADELLAARSLGALLLLLPAPVLAAVRTSYSIWRWPVGIAAYCMVVAGIWLVLSPYRFRMSAGACAGNDARCRMCGAVLTLLGAFFIALAAVTSQKL